MKKYYPILKWLILTIAGVYLAYMLCRFFRSGNSTEFWHQWQAAFARNLLWLGGVFFLLPFNWLAESRKWQILLKNVEQLSLVSAFRSVLGGAAAAFFTPNRLGEFPARSLFLAEGNRAKGILLGFVGSLSQTLTTAAFGIIFLPIYFFNFNNTAFYLALCLFAVISIFYLFLPKICAKLLPLKSLQRFGGLLQMLSELQKTLLAKVLLVSALRYVFYCVQFFCMLRFFGVELSAWQGAAGIAVNYLFVTFTPSIGFSEGVARSSISTLIFSAFSPNIAGIAAAGISVWLVNFVLPMLIGAVIFSRSKIKK